jgi:hypothetical protein
MTAGTVLFGMDWGPSVPIVLAVLGAWATFNAALAIVLGNVARTAGRSSGIGVMTTMMLAALGGAWWPIEITPAWMQQLGSLLPTGWAMNAIHRLVNFVDPSLAAVPHLAAMLGGALVLGWIGAVTFRCTTVATSAPLAGCRSARPAAARNMLRFDSHAHPTRDKAGLGPVAVRATASCSVDQKRPACAGLFFAQNLIHAAQP